MPYSVVSKDGKQTFGSGYETEEDAQAFIDSHLAAQKVGAKVVEETAEAEADDAA